MADTGKKKRTFRKFAFRGVELDQLLATQSFDEALEWWRLNKAALNVDAYVASKEAVVVYTMQPWATRFEQAINAKLIDPQDTEVLFAEFLMDGLVRGDITARYGAYEKGFGKWLTSKSRILIVDEPTRGVDVGAKAAIHGLLNDLASGGATVVMISSELPELMGMSDRILMLHDGRVTGAFARAEATQERLLAAAMGH